MVVVHGKGWGRSSTDIPLFQGYCSIDNFAPAASRFVESALKMSDLGSDSVSPSELQLGYGHDYFAITELVSVLSSVESSCLYIICLHICAWFWHVCFMWKSKLIVICLLWSISWNLSPVTQCRSSTTSYRPSIIYQCLVAIHRWLPSLSGCVQSLAAIQLWPQLRSSHDLSGCNESCFCHCRHLVPNCTSKSCIPWMLLQLWKPSNGHLFKPPWCSSSTQQQLSLVLPHTALMEWNIVHD